MIETHSVRSRYVVYRVSGTQVFATKIETPGISTCSGVSGVVIVNLPVNVMTASDIPTITPDVVVGDDDTTPEKPCSTRIVDDLGEGWCILPPKHSSPCQRVPSRFGPQLPPPDRKLMSAYRSDISLKWNSNPVKQAEWLAKWGLR